MAQGTGRLVPRMDRQHTLHKHIRALVLPRQHGSETQIARQSSAGVRRLVRDTASERAGYKRQVHRDWRMKENSRWRPGPQLQHRPPTYRPIVVPDTRCLARPSVRGPRTAILALVCRRHGVPGGESASVDQSWASSAARASRAVVRSADVVITMVPGGGEFFSCLTWTAGLSTQGRLSGVSLVSRPQEPAAQSLGPWRRLRNFAQTRCHCRPLPQTKSFPLPLLVLTALGPNTAASLLVVTRCCFCSSTPSPAQADVHFQSTRVLAEPLCRPDVPSSSPSGPSPPHLLGYPGPCRCLTNSQFPVASLPFLRRLCPG